jgi:hypothetical protein
MTTLHKKKGKDQVYTCPACLQPKLNYRADKGTGKCNACQKGWSKWALEKAGLKFPDPLLDLTIPAETKVKELPALKRVGESTMGKMALSLRNWDLGSWTDYCWVAESEQRLYFQLFSPVPSTVYSHRSVYPSQPGWYMTAPKRGHYFGKFSIGEWAQELVVCEGVGDILTLGLWGRGIALMGTSMQPVLQQHLLALGIRDLAVWLDWDGPESGDGGPGRQGALKLKRELQGCFNVRIVDCKRDPKTLTPADVERYL